MGNEARNACFVCVGYCIWYLTHVQVLTESSFDNKDIGRLPWQLDMGLATVGCFSLKRFFVANGNFLR